MDDITKFNEWRKRTCEGIPDLARRVFALRGVGYMGCGFHWSLEHDLGRTITVLNDFNTDYSRREKQIVAEVIVSRMFEQVATIEKSLTTAECGEK